MRLHIGRIVLVSRSQLRPLLFIELSLNKKITGLCEFSCTFLQPAGIIKVENMESWRLLFTHPNP